VLELILTRQILGEDTLARHVFLFVRAPLLLQPVRHFGHIFPRADVHSFGSSHNSVIIQDWTPATIRIRFVLPRPNYASGKIELRDGSPYSVAWLCRNEESMFRQPLRPRAGACPPNGNRTKPRGWAGRMSAPIGRAKC